MQTYKAEFNDMPEAVTIHAGLECAIFDEAIPGMQIISFGPTITGAHTTKESVDIRTVEKAWQFLLAILVS